jgi:FkbM family methyltransferase
MSLKRFLLKTMDKIAKPYGSRVVKKQHMASWDHLFTLIEKYDMTPATVFDVGIAYGTKDLYRRLPNAKYYLFDPLKESVPHMEKAQKKLNAEIFNIGLGDEDSTISMLVRENLGGSSMFTERGTLESPELATYEVPVKRLDQVVPEFATPALCKIDVQGAELSVLKGMTGIINKVDIFIIEVNTIEVLVGIPLFADIVAFMDAQGFAIYELMMIGRRPLDDATAQLDVAFVKKDGPFLADKRYAA